MDRSVLAADNTLCIMHKKGAGMSIKRRDYRKANGTTTTTYLAVVHLGHGRQIAKTFDRAMDARKWASDGRRAVRSGQSKDYVNGAMRFQALAHYWFEHHARVYKSPAAIRRDEQLLRNQILPKLRSPPLNTGVVPGSRAGSRCCIVFLDFPLRHS